MLNWPTNGPTDLKIEMNLATNLGRSYVLPQQNIFPYVIKIKKVEIFMVIEY